MDRFSQRYLQKGLPGKDSRRFRTRLARFYDDLVRGPKNTWRLEPNEPIRMIEREAGATVPWRHSPIETIRYFLVDGELRDVLDCITFVWRQAESKDSGIMGVQSGYLELAPRWLMFVRRAIAEENLGCRVDDNAVVHLGVDEEFEQQRPSILTCLEAPRHSAVLHEVDAAYEKLDPNEDDTNGAIRNMFLALEILVKVIVDSNKVKRLNDSAIKNYLAPWVAESYGQDEAARNAANQMTQSLCDWANAAHPYRHGQKTEEPLNAPIELAVAMIGTGATHIRWLVTLDSRRDG